MEAEVQLAHSEEAVRWVVWFDWLMGKGVLAVGTFCLIQDVIHTMCRARDAELAACRARTQQLESQLRAKDREALKLVRQADTAKVSMG
jgi:hypothetical protein